MLYTFTRTHIPTGSTYIGEFTPANHEVFHNPDWYPQRTLDKAMSDCINRWNRQQPTTWHYTLNN